MEPNVEPALKRIREGVMSSGKRYPSLAALIRDILPDRKWTGLWSAGLKKEAFNPKEAASHIQLDSVILSLADEAERRNFGHRITALAAQEKLKEDNAVTIGRGLAEVLMFAARQEARDAAKRERNAGERFLDVGQFALNVAVHLGLKPEAHKGLAGLMDRVFEEAFRREAGSIDGCRVLVIHVSDRGNTALFDECDRRLRGLKNRNVYIEVVLDQYQGTFEETLPTLLSRTGSHETVTELFKSGRLSLESVRTEARKRSPVDLDVIFQSILGRLKLPSSTQEAVFDVFTGVPGRLYLNPLWASYYWIVHSVTSNGLLRVSQGVPAEAELLNFIKLQTS